MRNILWILILATVISADEAKYAIEVLNIQDTQTVAADFEKQAKATMMPYTQKHTKGRYRVFLGAFKTHEEAVSNLTLVREQVNKDAFVVRMEEESGLDPQQKMQQAIVMAQAKSLQKADQEEIPDVLKEPEAAPQIAEPEPEKKIIIVKQDNTPVRAVKEEKRENTYCKPSKKALRESEISDAIAFYAKSSYYKFTE